MTLRYLISTSGDSTSCCQVSVCFIQFSSSRCEKRGQRLAQALGRASTYLGVVLTGVGTTGLLAGGSGGDSLDGALEEVAELEGLNEVTEEGDVNKDKMGTIAWSTYEFQIIERSLIPTSL